ncbi:MAG TPA: D-2-hydroxyacid dehydrogenase [Bryobacteraceae bacterium]|jgi:phosphoglycerate dehydrogenase-like enzyme|nr:D-2-hydroxyacid dehydrogenase [Bryobacteraceae bacterium]
MNKPNVLAIFPPDHYALRGLKPILDEGNFCISRDPEVIREFLPRAEIILSSGLTGKTISLRDLWPLAKNVKWVHSLSAGVENLLFPELIESPVPVTNARGVFKRSLAEFSVLGMLYFYKQVARLTENKRAHNWEPFDIDWLTGRIMGVVGYGEIGRECAILAKALGLKIYALRRRPEKSASDPIIDKAFGPADLHNMLAAVDVLVAAAPNTPETHHMINDEAFKAMKPTAIVINVGRGPVIDEAALIRALQEKRIAAAALDVFEHEPLPSDHPFWDMPNVLISPHSADHTRDPDWLDLAVLRFVENFHRYQKGEPLEPLVDKKAGY